MMKQILGYLLGFCIFIAGLAHSIWSIVHMKRVGKGNPFDAMGHEVAPRTRHLMTDGPYKLSRNPMLSGTYLYYIGVLIALWNGWALLVFAVVMMLQVRCEALLAEGLYDTIGTDLHNERYADFFDSFGFKA